jgi:hypothetical protein
MALASFLHGAGLRRIGAHGRYSLLWMGMHMIDECPHCHKAYDHDGFYEHRTETLYFCTCQAIFDSDHKLYSKEQIDMEGLTNQGGLFIKASRRKIQEGKPSKKNASAIDVLFTATVKITEIAKEEKDPNRQRRLRLIGEYMAKALAQIAPSYSLLNKEKDVAKL